MRPNKMAGNIVVPIDFSDVTPLVLDKAAALARALQAKIWLIHVAPPEPDFIGYEIGPEYIRDAVAREIRLEHQRLQEHQGKLQQEGLDVTALLVPGMPAEKILDESRRLQADLIVMGSHGHGRLWHLLTGSVCHGVLRGATCPVVVVPARSAQ